MLALKLAPVLLLKILGLYALNPLQAFVPAICSSFARKHFIPEGLISAKATTVYPAALHRQIFVQLFLCEFFTVSISYNSLIKIFMECGATSSPPKYGYSLYPSAFMVELFLGNESIFPLRKN